MNINTREYWERRFARGDWESRGGRGQTRVFAETQIPLLKIPADFPGTILDFGCGLGDAIPVYHRAFPQARLMGIDLSQAAIESCRRDYGDLAEFHQGDHHQVPHVDVIIASNVLEHLSKDQDVARHLVGRCRELYIIVPYRQVLAQNSEHVNTYDEHSFDALGPVECTIFLSRGWSQYGWDLWFRTYALNLVRPLLGKRVISRHRQILFHLTSRHPRS